MTNNLDDLESLLAQVNIVVAELRRTLPAPPVRYRPPAKVGQVWRTVAGEVGVLAGTPHSSSDWWTLVGLSGGRLMDWRGPHNHDPVAMTACNPEPEYQLDVCVADSLNKYLDEVRSDRP